MIDKETAHTYRYLNKEINRFISKLKQISFPGLEKVPIYDVIIFFFNGLKKGALNLRATAIAFNFMLALGPALIFFLALLPYLPIENFQVLLEDFLHRIIPGNSFIVIEPIIDEVFKRRGGLPIFGLLTSLFFAQKGIHGIIEAFNATFHAIETRSWYRQRMASIVLIFIFFGIATLASFIFIFSKGIITSMITAGQIHVKPVFFVLLYFFIS